MLGLFRKKGKIMKILVISTVNFELNGISNVILNYYRAMDKVGFQIDLVSPNKVSNDLANEFASYGSKVYPFPNRMKEPVSYVKALSSLIKTNGYEIVHAHGNSTTLFLEMQAAKIAGVKIRIAHSHSTTCKFKRVNKVLRPLFDKSYTHGFACVDAAGKWLFREKDFTVINNGIDIDLYKFNASIREEFRKKLIVQDDEIIIGHVGNFSILKNQDFLLDLMNELKHQDKKYRLLLIGEGELQSSIIDRVRNEKLESKVNVLGISYEVHNWMQAMDIFVMPSKHEGFPLTIIEAQASGLPCILSSNITKDVNLDNKCKFINLNSIDEWIASITTLSPTIREVESINNISSIQEKEYDINTNANKLMMKYKELISE